MIEKGKKMRKDITLKNLIRAIKRYYASKWVKGKTLTTVRDRKRLEEAFKVIDDVAKNLFSQYFSEEEIRNTPSTLEIAEDKDHKKEHKALQKEKSFADVKLILACLVFSKVMSSYMKTPWRKKLMESLNQVLYQFSLWRLHEILKYKSLSLIIYDFNMHKLPIMLKEDRTICREPNAYKEAKEYINTLINSYNKF